MKCENPECEDGWINVRNMTVPPRPCLALSCPFGTKLIQVPATGHASRGVAIGDQPDRYPAPLETDELLARTLTEQSRRHAKSIRDLSRSTRIVVRTLDNEIERLARLVKHGAVWIRQAEFAAPTDTAAWGACPECGCTSKQGHDDGCPIAAWLKETSEDKP